MSSTAGDFSVLKRVAQDALMHCLEVFPGTKDIIIENSLMQLLDRIANLTLLRQHGVDKIYKLHCARSGGAGVSGHFGANEQRIFLISPRIASAKLVAESVVEDQTRSTQRKCCVVFVPRKSVGCEQLFEQFGVVGDILIEQYTPNLIPCDSFYLSLGVQGLFSSFFVDGSSEHLYSVAQSLWQLQTLFGPITNVYTVGHAAERTMKLVEKLVWEHGEFRMTPDAMFSHLFLIDRDTDYASVLLSCLTYESLLDEEFGIRSGVVELPAEVVKSADKSAVKLLLTDNDVFNAIRYRHFSTVFPFLSTKVRELEQKRPDALSKISDLKQFVSQELRGLKQQQKSLVLLFAASETILHQRKKANFEELLQVEHSIMMNSDSREIIASIEDVMAQQLPEHISLSLLCLFSLLQNGIASKDYNSLRAQYLQAYGHKNLFAFYCLKKLGILVEKDASGGFKGVNTALSTAVAASPLAPSGAAARMVGQLFQAAPSPLTSTSSFPALMRKLNAGPRTDDVNVKDPVDLSYMFNGAYVPLICQIVSVVLQSGFQSAQQELCRCLPPGHPIAYRNSSNQLATTNVRSNTSSKKSVLVFVLGGVTYAELAGLRLLGRLKDYTIVVASDEIISRKQFLRFNLTEET